MMSWDGRESFDAVGERRRERLGDMLDIMAESHDNRCQRLGNNKTKVISFYLAGSASSCFPVSSGSKKAAGCRD